MFVILTIIQAATSIAIPYGFSSPMDKHKCTKRDISDFINFSQDNITNYKEHGVYFNLPQQFELRSDGIYVNVSRHSCRLDIDEMLTHKALSNIDYVTQSNEDIGHQLSSIYNSLNYSNDNTDVYTCSEHGNQDICTWDSHNILLAVIDKHPVLVNNDHLVVLKSLAKAFEPARIPNQLDYGEPSQGYGYRMKQVNIGFQVDVNNMSNCNGRTSRGSFSDMAVRMLARWKHWGWDQEISHDVESTGGGGYIAVVNGDKRSNQNRGCIKDAMDLNLQDNICVPSGVTCIRVALQGNEQGWTLAYGTDFFSIQSTQCYSYGIAMHIFKQC